MLYTGRLYPGGSFINAADYGYFLRRAKVAQRNFPSETVEWWLRYHFTVQENTQCRDLARTNGIVEDF